jgi:hypothetical protein
LLYAFICDDWLLRTEWNLGAHPHWPLGLILLRDAAHASFVIFALVFVAGAVRDEWEWRIRLPSPAAVLKPAKPKTVRRKSR